MSSIEGTNGEIERAQAAHLQQAASQAIEATAAWESTETALYKDINGIFLGATVRKGGWGSDYKDESETPVGEAGMFFGVKQSSAGYTGMFARAMDGYKVEALNPDASSRRTMWRGSQYEDGEVHINGDYGKLGEIAPGTDWSKINFGNPGTRSGIVRITHPDGQQRYYALAANFRGQPDSWRVNGSIAEVQPNEQLALMVAPPHELPAGKSDRSVNSKALGGNLVSGVHVDSAVIRDFRTAFEHETPGVHILHADSDSAKNAKEYADAGLELLIELAKADGEIFADTEEMFDELGRRARLINKHGAEKGFLDPSVSDDVARTKYLTKIREQIQYATSNDDTAHRFQFLTHEVFNVLEKSFSDGARVMIPPSAPVVVRIADMVMSDRQQTAAIQARRQAILQGTVLDRYAPPQGIAYRAAIPGQKIQLNLQDYLPLLTAEQTREGFCNRLRTDADSVYTTGFYAPTIAILEIEGNRYALIDTRDESGRPRKSYYDRREESEFKLLQIVNDREDPRSGYEVADSRLGFSGKYDHTVQTIMDVTRRDEKGLLKETGITVEFDAEANQLTIFGLNSKVGIIAPHLTAKIVTLEALDRTSVEHREKVREWEQAVKSVKQSTTILQEELEDNLQYAIEDGRMTPETIERRRAEIAKIVARGPRRSHTYNGYRGDKWHRSQTYYVTVDEQGNIWGDFEYTRGDSNVTGRPVSEGKHLIHRNPNLPEEPRRLFASDAGRIGISGHTRNQLNR